MQNILCFNANSDTFVTTFFEFSIKKECPSNNWRTSQGYKIDEKNGWTTLFLLFFLWRLGHHRHELNAGKVSLKHWSNVNAVNNWSHLKQSKINVGSLSRKVNCNVLMSSSKSAHDLCAYLSRQMSGDF